ncbi:MAG: histidine kinase [Lachnospiraceae bacterium]|nr:histidine kinase [Lachnospiraceae bacterium]
MKKHAFFDSIYTSFLIRLLLLTFIPIALVGIILSYNSYQDRQNRKFEPNQQVNASVVHNIHTNMEYTSATTQALLSNNTFTAFLKNNFSIEKDYTTYNTTIQSYVDATIQANAHSDTFIYVKNNTIPMSMDVFYHLSDIENVDVIADFLASDAIECWLCRQNFKDISNPYLFPVENRFIYLRKAYDYKKSFLGILAFSIPESSFLSFDAQNKGTVLSSGHQRIINLSGEDLDADTLSSICAMQTAQAQFGSYLTAKETTENFPFSIITVTKYTNYGQLLILFLLLLICFAFISIILSLRSIKQIVAQMHNCLTAMDTSISNNYSTRIPVTGKNEISNICQRINLLLNQASDLAEQNIRKETSNKENRLIALQHQINPHFIYNTMEVFSSKMKLYGHYDESDAMVAFANIFRYNISTNDALVTLREELGQVRNYFDIQKLRYPLLSLEEELDPALFFALLPKFTLQPIIENAITHGISSASQTLAITISARKEKDMLFISIKDNGHGMLPKELDTLQKKLSSTENITTDGHSVGLKNVNTRLILYFGNSARLSIDSRYQEYTTVSFCIPYRHITP